ncbi:MAG: hypothetical protein JO286_07260, partial [Solirubrobacterales bacterium]|nr:hypothetical protein [Solirubrobacterales bacterium]
MPVAVTPGLGPHDDVLDDAVEPPDVDVADAELLLPAAAALLVLLLLLLPQPAIATAPPRIAKTNPRRMRERETDDQRRRIGTSVVARPGDKAVPTLRRTDI